MQFKQNVKLAPYTTYKIGGPAKYFFEAGSEEQILEALEWARHTPHLFLVSPAGKNKEREKVTGRENEMPIFILGGGSNILVSDEGFDGLVIFLNLKGIEQESEENVSLLKVYAGENWDRTVEHVVGLNLQGIECLSGIPGSVGAALAQNIDAYGQSFSDVFVSANVIDFKTGKSRVFIKKDCRLGYHDSIFKQESGRYVITSVVLRLKKGAKPNLNYKDYRFAIAEYLANKKTNNPTLNDVRLAVMDIRKKKGMLVGETHHVLGLRLPKRGDYKTVGSFFKNVIVGEKEFEQIKSKAQKQDAKKEEALRPWYWPQENGSIKVSSAFLLEYTKFEKGQTYGKAKISPKHILAIINPGDATAKDIIKLALDMQKAVKRKFGVVLEPELNFVGFDKYPLIR